ncbi:MAG: hypothetical protein HMLKMBBP_02113 [Planctomycetes bacterium]|nr:hypothetical protein [Planctomycetota bacterium]
MGRRGPPPLPSATKLARGTFRPHRSRGEPVPAPGVPTPPPWLPPLAREEWDRIIPLLRARGLVEEIDSAALVGYCTAWSDMADAMRVLREEGTTVADARGGLSAHPELRRMEAAREALRKFAQEFGLSPSARSRVSSTPPRVRSPEAEARRRRYFFRTPEEQGR